VPGYSLRACGLWKSLAQLHDQHRGQAQSRVNLPRPSMIAFGAKELDVIPLRAERSPPHSYVRRTT
jgi:hypothetical protein